MHKRHYKSFAGTLSEIAVAMKSGTPVIGLHCPRFALGEEYKFISVGTVDESMQKIEEIVTKLSEKD